MKNNVNYSTKEKYALCALNWCEFNFGKCKRKKRNLVLQLSPQKKYYKRSKYFGKYCFYKNKLTIYINNCETLLDIVQTIIHEYSHYLQSRTKYEYYSKIYNYSNNPLEKEAKNNELKYGQKCLNYINNQFNTSKSTISFK